MQHELELRAKINAILTEGEEPEQLNESITLAVLGAVLSFALLVMKSIDVINNGAGAPGYQMMDHRTGDGDGGPRSHPSIWNQKAEKRYHEDITNKLAELYENAMDLARRYPRAAKFFHEAARYIRRMVILSKDHNAHELKKMGDQVYEWMHRITRWAKQNDEEFVDAHSHAGRS